MKLSDAIAATDWICLVGNLALDVLASSQNIAAKGVTISPEIQVTLDIVRN